MLCQQHPRVIREAHRDAQATLADSMWMASTGKSCRLAFAAKRKRALRVSGTTKPPWPDSMWLAESGSSLSNDSTATHCTPRAIWLTGIWNLVGDTHPPRHPALTCNRGRCHVVRQELGLVLTTRRSSLVAKTGHNYLGRLPAVGRRFWPGRRCPHCGHWADAGAS